MTPQNHMYLTLARSLRGTPSYVIVRRLISDLRRERQFRKHIEELRQDQSARLLQAAQQRDMLLTKVTDTTR